MQPDFSVCACLLWLQNHVELNWRYDIPSYIFALAARTSCVKLILNGLVCMGWILLHNGNKKLAFQMQNIIK